MASLPFTRTVYEINSPRLIIRTANQSDAETFHAFLTTPENFPFEDPEQDLTIQKVRTRIGRFAELTAAGKMGLVVVILRKTNELIGYGGYNTFELVDPVEFLPETTLPPGNKYMTDLGS